eukprot:scaffold2025_cov386-Prasinococcus_capsulatus_cf.AAC.1
MDEALRCCVCGGGGGASLSYPAPAGRGVTWALPRLRLRLHRHRRSARDGREAVAAAFPWLPPAGDPPPSGAPVGATSRGHDRRHRARRTARIKRGAAFGDELTITPHFARVIIPNTTGHTKTR